MSATKAEELRQWCRREPFQPFRVHINNGDTYDVLTSMECLVGEIALVLPIHDADDPTLGYPAFLEVGQVTRVEPITQASANGAA